MTARIAGPLVDNGTSLIETFPVLMPTEEKGTEENGAGFDRAQVALENTAARDPEAR